MYLGAGTIFDVGAVHYLAGIWEDDFPVGFQYVTVDQWIEFMVAGSPWQPSQFLLEYYVWGCMDDNVPWDPIMEWVVDHTPRLTDSENPNY